MCKFGAKNLLGGWTVALFGLWFVCGWIGPVFADEPSFVRSPEKGSSCIELPDGAYWRVTPEWLWFLAIEEAERPSVEDVEAFDRSQKVFLDRLFAGLDARFTTWNKKNPRLVGALQNLLADVAAMARLYDPTREYKFSFHKSIQLRLQTFLKSRRFERTAKRLTPAPVPPEPSSDARKAREYARIYAVNLAREEGWVQAAILLHLVRSEPELRESLETYHEHARALHDASPHWARLIEAGKGLSFALPQDIENEENLEALQRAYEASEDEQTPRALGASGGPAWKPFEVLAFEGADFTREIPESWQGRPGPWSGALSLLAEAGYRRLESRREMDRIEKAPLRHPEIWESCLGLAKLEEDFSPQSVAACFVHRVSVTSRSMDDRVTDRPMKFAARAETYAALANLAQKASVLVPNPKRDIWWSWAGRFTQLARLSQESGGKEFVLPASLGWKPEKMPDLGLPMLWRISGGGSGETSSARLGLAFRRCRVWSFESKSEDLENDSAIELFVEYGESGGGYPLQGDKAIFEASRYLPLPYLED